MVVIFCTFVDVRHERRFNYIVHFRQLSFAYYVQFAYGRAYFYPKCKTSICEMALENTLGKITWFLRFEMNRTDYVCVVAWFAWFNIHSKKLWNERQIDLFRVALVHLLLSLLLTEHGIQCFHAKDSKCIAVLSTLQAVTHRYTAFRRICAFFTIPKHVRLAHVLFAILLTKVESI